MRMDGEWRKIQALDQQNHSVDLGSIHPDTLKFTKGINKMEGGEGALLSLPG